MNKCNFSIIVLSHNNKYIQLVLECILAQALKEDEIIVVDDHSDARYLSELESFLELNNIQLLKSTKLANRSNSRNIGAKHATKEILVFIDGDMILYDRAIDSLREAHIHRQEKAFIGSKHYIHLDELHFKLYTGIDNYIDLLKTQAGRKVLVERTDACDEREIFFDDASASEYYWMHYYTGACSVERNLFVRIGGFDESFSSWGSEDVDLGYRISRISQIGFVKEFHSFHIPHPRDVFSIESSNMQNTLKMLKKYMTWEFEAMYAFNSNPDTIKSFMQVISQMRMLDLHSISLDASTDLVINAISKEYPNGNVIYSTASIIKYMTLMGLAIPFCSKHFERVFISENIFIYPMQITCRILQEAIRVGKRVFIKKTPCSTRIDWYKKTNIPPLSSNHKIAFRSEDIMDYYFVDKGNVIEVSLALPHGIMRDPIFWENTHEDVHYTKDS